MLCFSQQHLAPSFGDHVFSIAFTVLPCPVQSQQCFEPAQTLLCKLDIPAYIVCKCE